MNWMFWKSEGQTKNLPGPIEIPQAIGSYLVSKEGMNANLVWALKSVMLPRPDEKYVFDIRVYDSKKTGIEGVKVEDYHSLDDHPALVIYDGWYNRKTYASGKRNL
jgi:hypothetical protein